MTIRPLAGLLSGFITMNLVSAGCSGGLPESSEWTSVALRDMPETMIDGDTLRLSLRVKYGPERERLYDFVEDDLELKVESDSDVAEYLGDGLVRASAPGMFTLSISSPKTESVSDRATVTVQERTFSNVIGQELHGRLIRASATFQYDSRMQTFGLTSRGDLYMCTQNAHRVSIYKVAKDGTSGEPMTFLYSGDGTTFAIEEDGNDVYVWVSAYGTKSDDGTYTGMGVIAREKFSEGGTFMPEDCTDCYYVGMHDVIRLSVDSAEDRVSFLWSDTSVPGYDSSVRNYSLSELKALSKTQITLPEITIGSLDDGDLGGERTMTPEVAAADISVCAPLSSVGVLAADMNSFCMSGQVCFLSGDAGDAGPVITSLDFATGSYFFIRIPFAVDDDAAVLAGYGVSDTGVLNSAGMVYVNGCLYHGFTSEVEGRVVNTVIRFGELALEELSLNDFGAVHEPFGAQK